MSPTNTAGALHAFRRRRDRGVLRVTGRDRIDWLNGLLTNDLKSREGPRACPALWLTPQGRMITDVVVLELGEETWLDVPASLAAALAERFDRMIFAEDARVADASSELTSTGVYGSGAIELLREAMGPDAPGDVPDPSALAIGHAPQNEGRVVCTHAIASGLPGVHVYQAHPDAQRFEDAMLTGRRRFSQRDNEGIRLGTAKPD